MSKNMSCETVRFCDLDLEREIYVSPHSRQDRPPPRCLAADQMLESQQQRALRRPVGVPGRWDHLRAAFPVENTRLSCLV